MDLQQAIETRRAIRRFSSQTVDDTLLAAVVDAARYAPSSGSSQPWKFIATRDKDIMRRVFATYAYVPGSGYDSLKWQANPEEVKVPDDVLPPVLILNCADLGRIPYRGSAYLSVAIAVENMWLKATSLGLGGCWVFIWDDEDHERHIREIYELPQHLAPVSMFILGYPAETPKVRHLRELAEILEIR